MSNTHETSPVPADTITVILEVVQRANEPLTLKRLKKELPGPFRADLATLARVMDDQVRIGAVHKWLPRRSQERFWTHNVEAYSRSKILEILSGQSLTHKELERALKNSLFGCSENKAAEMRKKILNCLLEKRCVYKYPLPPRQRSPRFGVNPPDPTPYLGRVKKEFEAVCDKLKKVRLSRDQVFHAVSKLLSPLPPGPESDVEKGPSNLETQPAEEVYKSILEKIREIEPAAEQQALVSIPSLRAALKLLKETFDQAILDLADQGKIFLHRHVYPSETNDDQRMQMVTDGKGNYYVGLVLRSYRFSDK